MCPSFHEYYATGLRNWETKSNKSSKFTFGRKGKLTVLQEGDSMIKCPDNLEEEAGLFLLLDTVAPLCKTRTPADFAKCPQSEVIMRRLLCIPEH